MFEVIDYTFSEICITLRRQPAGYQHAKNARNFLTTAILDPRAAFLLVSASGIAALGARMISALSPTLVFLFRKGNSSFVTIVSHADAVISSGNAPHQ